MIARCKSRAKIKGIPFDLDIYFEELSVRCSKLRCEISGVDLLPYGTGNQSINSMSIDRIIPEKGYVYSNIRIISFALNTAYGSWGKEAFEELFRKTKQAW
jgi:hypothetical protein